jgi:hypothetical protein
MAVHSIPAPIAAEICRRIDGVANYLRAMRDLAIEAETDHQRSAACVAVVGLCERAHLTLDNCIMKMGNIGIGNFRDEDRWPTDEQE